MNKTKILRQQMDATFKWLLAKHEELSDAKVKMICSYLYADGTVETVGSGDPMFYYVALVHQIRAAKLDGMMETDAFFRMLREMYDTVEMMDRE